MFRFLFRCAAVLPRCCCGQFSHFKVCSKTSEREALTHTNVQNEPPGHRIRDMLLVNYSAHGVRAHDCIFCRGPLGRHTNFDLPCSCHAPDIPGTRTSSQHEHTGTATSYDRLAQLEMKHLGLFWLGLFRNIETQWRGQPRDYS
jgi:hypothetical protein